MSVKNGSWRLLAVAGALCAAAAVAMAAHASHGLEGLAQSRAQTAALFAFGHGAVLALMTPVGRLERGAAALLLVGMLLFAGSLAAGVYLGWSTRLAPFGGLTLMLGWLVLALARLRG